MKFLAVFAGGIGPDVWDKETMIDAADFADAARMVNSRAEEAGGTVLHLEEWGGPHDPVAKHIVFTLRRWASGDISDAPAGLDRQADGQLRCLADWIESHHIINP